MFPGLLLRYHEQLHSMLMSASVVHTHLLSVGFNHCCHSRLGSIQAQGLDVEQRSCGDHVVL